MVDPRIPGDFGQPSKVRFRYQFIDGTVGRGYSDLISSVADLAVIKIDKPPPFGYAVLGEKPEVGDKISWTEFDFRKRKNIYKPREREGEVTNILAGVVFLDEKVTLGASGGCAYNDKDEVVGLVTFRMTTDDVKDSTGITGLWGDWFKDVEE